MPGPDHPLLTPAYGKIEETVSRSSYHWDSRHRGKSPFVILQATHSGFGIYEERGKRHEVPRGHAFVTVVPEDVRYYYPEGGREPWVFSWINFYGDQGIRLWKWFRQRYGSVFPMEERSAARLIFDGLLAMTEGRKAADDFQASSESYRFAMTLAGQLESKGHAPVSAIHGAARLMQRQPLRTMAIKEFAARAGLSREHFTRLFHREMGVSPARYRRERQLDVAADWLLRTNLPVQEVALRSGFASGRQLTKMFRHFRGRSPLEFRRRKRAAGKQSA